MNKISEFFNYYYKEYDPKDKVGLYLFAAAAGVTGIYIAKRCFFSRLETLVKERVSRHIPPSVTKGITSISAKVSSLRTPSSSKVSPPSATPASAGTKLKIAKENATMLWGHLKGDCEKLQGKGLDTAELITEALNRGYTPESYLAWKNKAYTSAKKLDKDIKRISEKVVSLKLEKMSKEVFVKSVYQLSTELNKLPTYSEEVFLTTLSSVVKDVANKTLQFPARDQFKLLCKYGELKINQKLTKI